MIDSAPSLREQHISATAQRLRATARKHTATVGLAGFTIEELCEEVGVSRRTFFNYFASKENAVLGISLRSDVSDLDDAYVAGGPTGNLIQDLAELQAVRWERMDMHSSELDSVAAALDREPALLSSLLDLVAKSDRDDIARTEEREKFFPGDERAVTAVRLVGSLMRPTVAEYLSGADYDFRTLLFARLEIARELLAG
ncbi:AcrR family transcriptional regulator [Microbacterium halimionae]|uniref:AcrR family transcriptional regulator n=1 Tax=Microbacterium halimionae TaxID=1526413 RepID=A0A7W3JLW2_9MICO|nr:TetR/AcrR family transcriptional regulator [Microbacterium halimionae]MBA8815223.1 AcrR family transcriptional regulator [Microbacterium halimionae]NII93986.1 AcrR family transcriptional regulator [Microbacterium halimionae]